MLRQTFRIDDPDSPIASLDQPFLSQFRQNLPGRDARNADEIGKLLLRDLEFRSFVPCHIGKHPRNAGMCRQIVVAFDPIERKP